jgi:hypothetical protein
VTDSWLIRHERHSMREMFGPLIQGWTERHFGRYRNQVPPLRHHQPSEASRARDRTPGASIKELEVWLYIPDMNPLSPDLPSAQALADWSSASTSQNPIPHCLFRRAGSLRRGHPRGADGGQGPGSRACLGRCQSLRWPPVAWQGFSRHWRIPLPAVFLRRPAARQERPPPSLAGHRPDRRRSRPGMVLLRKRRRSPQCGSRRGLPRPSPHGL